MTNKWIKCPLDIKESIQKYLKYNMIKEFMINALQKTAEKNLCCKYCDVKYGFDCQCDSNAYYWKIYEDKVICPDCNKLDLYASLGIFDSCNICLKVIEPYTFRHNLDPEDEIPHMICEDCIYTMPDNEIDLYLNDSMCFFKNDNEWYIHGYGTDYCVKIM